MSEKEKEILREIVNRGGLLSPADVINGIAKHDRRLVENLVVKGFIEEVPQDIGGVRMGSNHIVNFYRATEKGLTVFYPFYRKFWHIMKGDVRTIVISAITALLTTAVTILVQSIFG